MLEQFNETLLSRLDSLDLNDHEAIDRWLEKLPNPDESSSAYYDSYRQQERDKSFNFTAHEDCEDHDEDSHSPIVIESKVFGRRSDGGWVKPKHLKQQPSIIPRVDLDDDDESAFDFKPTIIQGGNPQEEATTTQPSGRSASLENVDDERLSKWVDDTAFAAARKKIEEQQRRRERQIGVGQGGTSTSKRWAIPTIPTASQDRYENISGFSDNHDEPDEYAKVSSEDGYQLSETVTESSRSKQGNRKPGQGTGFIRPTSATASLKKHDPVQRFREHQKQWSQDTFLKRSGKAPVASAEYLKVTQVLPKRP
ncbi:hypothetical protein HDU76_011917 [Blyttiomyces sp. JEL0837]|nr:hypothetical protein HDU76_011917 [Blyttiomyces sp. JEL0837]